MLMQTLLQLQHLELEELPIILRIFVLTNLKFDTNYYTIKNELFNFPLHNTCFFCLLLTRQNFIIFKEQRKMFKLNIKFWFYITFYVNINVKIKLKVS